MYDKFVFFFISLPEINAELVILLSENRILLRDRVARGRKKINKNLNMKIIFKNLHIY